MKPASLPEALNVTITDFEALWQVAAQYTGPAAIQAPHTNYAQDLQILRDRYTRDGQPRASLADLAARYHVSRVRVRARLVRILDWLRAPEQQVQYARSQ